MKLAKLRIILREITDYKDFVIIQIVLQVFENLSLIFLQQMRDQSNFLNVHRFRQQIHLYF